eukprot:TRINITY_DN170270_c0_g1_i8.p1 TRINITY_DN170270_c0_g1~~TRINITY_DN170270_c0_g1_i8.p1  ORF type:complete len:195 (-),score=70.17 TRINITY_DN170270_c0_g1_i8:255-839(-)
MDWNQLVSASLGITVTDEAVRQMTEKRKLAPSLPALVLLDPEVDHLEDSEVYMAEGDEAKTRMDLLLGTQGWRRFSYSTPKEFEEETERKNQLRDQDMSDEEWKEKVNYLFGFSHQSRSARRCQFGWEDRYHHYREGGPLSLSRGRHTKAGNVKIMAMNAMADDMEMGGSIMMAVGEAAVLEARNVDMLFMVRN